MAIHFRLEHAWISAIGKNGIVYVSFESTWWTGKISAISNGTGIWSYGTPNIIYSSPAIASNGTVYIADTKYYNPISSKLYSITNGVLVWTNTTGGYAWTAPEVQSSPAIGVDGTIYIACYAQDWGQGRLFAITNGAVKWSFITGSAFFSSPALYAGKVYIGCDDGNIYAITNGTVKWQYLTGGSVQSSPAIDSCGRVYVGSLDGNVYVISNAIPKWVFSTGGPIHSSPAIGANNIIYIGSDDGKIYAITNGTEKWEFPTGGAIESSPAIGSDGTIYVGSSDGKLYAIVENALPKLTWTGNPGYITDGVKPNTNIGGSYFRFEIKCKDADNVKPITNQVWVDLNDDNIYEMNEKFTLFSNSGTSYSNGIIYTNSLQLYYAGDGKINYTFYFRDKYDQGPLPCAATSNHILVITNHGHVPSLGWTGEPGFLTDGVNPNTNLGGTNFVFRVSYTNAIAPISQQVWIDTNDDGIYEAQEKFNMKEANPADVNYLDGKIYTFTNLFLYNGHSIIKYQFYFPDGISSPIGSPTTNHTFTIIKPILFYVKTNGNDSALGTSWKNAWKTIGHAASTVGASNIVYVSNGYYREHVLVMNSGSDPVNGRIVFKSYNPRQAIVDGNGANCFELDNGKNYITIDGFRLKNPGMAGPHGVEIYNSYAFTIANNEITSNDFGVSMEYASGTVTNNFIHNNNFGSGLGVRISDMSVSGMRFINNTVVNNFYGFYWTGEVSGNSWDSSSGNIFIGNNACRNSYYGFVYSFSGPGNVFINNFVNSNGYDGMNLRDSGNPGNRPGNTYISNNCFTGNGRSAIVLSTYDGQYADIYNNTFLNNNGDAIDIGLYYVNIRNNKIFSSVGNEISLGCSGHTVVGNYINKCQSGIIDNSSSCLFTNNFICSNSTSGVSIGVSGGVWYSNVIYRNNNYGMHLSAPYLSLYRNVIDNNGYGLYSDSQYQVIARNSICSNNNAGIYLLPSSFSNFICTNLIYGRNQSTGILDSAKTTRSSGTPSITTRQTEFGFPVRQTRT